MKLGKRIRLASNELDLLERVIGQELGFSPFSIADLRLLLHIVQTHTLCGAASTPDNKAMLHKLCQLAEFAEDQVIARIFQQ